MKKVFDFLPSIIFNIVETILIIALGLYFQIDIIQILIILMTFTLVRMLTKSALHYKNPISCLVWTTIMIASVFLITKVGIITTVLMTIIAGLVLSGKGNINDAYMWKGKKSNYLDIDEYLKEHENDPLVVQFENRLKDKKDLTYQLYILRFKEKLTFEKMQEQLDLDNRRIDEQLKAIALSFRIFCDI